MRNVKLFQTMSPKLWPRLLPILNPTRFTPGEVVCQQEEECSEMLIINDGHLHGATEVLGAAARRERSLTSGDSINVLCVLKLWNRSVETVTALSNVGSYAVNSDEFYNLFNHDNEIDSLAFADIVARELRNFKMVPDSNAPTALGMPLYMSFSCVSVMVVAAEGIIAADTGLMREASSDPYATIEMVDIQTRRTLNTRWFHKTPTIHKTLNPHWTERNLVEWKDVHLPFDSLGLRVRVVDEDTVGNDDTIGEVFLSVARLMEDANAIEETPKRRESKWLDVRDRIQVKAKSMRPTDKSSSGGILGLFKAVHDKVRPEPMSREEVEERFGAEDGKVLDRWYDIAPTEAMIQRAAKAGTAPDTKLGRIRICSWIQEQDFSDGADEGSWAEKA